MRTVWGGFSRALHVHFFDMNVVADPGREREGGEVLWNPPFNLYTCMQSWNIDNLRRSSTTGQRLNYIAHFCL